MGCAPCDAPGASVPEPSAWDRVAAATGDRELMAQLGKSELFRDYQQAFEATVGMPLTIASADAREWPALDARNPGGGPAPANVSRGPRGVELRGWVEAGAGGEVKTVTDRAGLSESAVPIRLGERVFGFLRTGRVRVGPIAPAETGEGRAEIDDRSARRAMGQPQYEAVLRLVVIFARHLSLLGNHMMIAGIAGESPRMARARSFIADRHGEALSLVEVAQAVHMSPYYFCKVFKEATGETFTHHLARVRIEEVKRSLLQCHLRISEAAFAAGFQSLSQFNRSFRDFTGETPSAYRARWCAAHAADPPERAQRVSAAPGRR